MSVVSDLPESKDLVLIGYKELAKITGYSPSSIQKWASTALHLLPRRFDTGTKAVRWLLSDVLVWQDKRIKTQANAALEAIPPTPNQAKFRALYERAGISQARAAELITEHGRRPMSERVGEELNEFSTRVCSGDRMIRQWLASPNTKKAVPCPDWAVTALEARLKFLKIID